MKNRNPALAIAAAAALAAILYASGYAIFAMRAVARIGVVDNARIMERLSEAIEVRNKLAEEEKGWMEQAKRLEDSVKASMDSMTAGYDKAGSERKRTLRDNLMSWNQELTRYATSTRKLADKRRDELMRPVLGRVDAFVKEWSDRNGYDVIYGTGTGGVIMSAAPRFNVTDRILQEMNSKYGKSPDTHPGDAPAVASQSATPDSK